MDQPLWSEPLQCSACEKELPSGTVIYVVCAHCAVFYFNVPDPNQLTLFEVPAPTEIH